MIDIDPPVLPRQNGRLTYAVYGAVRMAQAGRRVLFYTGSRQLVEQIVRDTLEGEPWPRKLEVRDANRSGWEGVVVDDSWVDESLGL